MTHPVAPHLPVLPHQPSSETPSSAPVSAPAVQSPLRTSARSSTASASTVGGANMKGATDTDAEPAASASATGALSTSKSKSIPAPTPTTTPPSLPAATAPPAAPPAPAPPTTAPPPPAAATFDIEHQPLSPSSGSDPRHWSVARKWAIVGMLSAGSWIPATSANIIFPALSAIEADLQTTAPILALSVSIFILVQGCGSLTFVPFTELYGRKWIYLTTLLVYSLTQLGAGLSRSVGLFIAMRVLGGYASSPLLTFAAGTIADLFEVEQRGRMLSIYYSAPLLGPSLAVLIGGALTQAGSWRVPFFFLTGAGFAILLTFILFFRETFRKERSLVWQKARARAVREAERKESGKGEKKLEAEKAKKRRSACLCFPQGLRLWGGGGKRSARNDCESSTQHAAPAAAVSRNSTATVVSQKAADIEGNANATALAAAAADKLERAATTTTSADAGAACASTTAPAAPEAPSVLHAEGGVFLSALEEYHQLLQSRGHAAADDDDNDEDDDAYARYLRQTAQLGHRPYHGHAAGVSSCSVNDLPPLEAGLAGAGAGNAGSRRGSGNGGGSAVDEDAAPVVEKGSTSADAPGTALRDPLANAEDRHPHMPALAHAISAPAGVIRSTTTFVSDAHADRARTQRPRACACVRGSTPMRAPSFAQGGGDLKRIVTASGEEVKIKIHFRDINPLIPIWQTVKQPHNILSLTYSGLTFASQYSISYTATQTFQDAPYSYDPLKVGLVLFALGAGGLIGSVVGGRITDARLIRIRKQTGQPPAAEERLMAIRIPCILTPFAFVAYAWLVQYKVHIAGPVVALFFLGLLQFAAYAAVLSYLVDSNKGRSSAAVSANSAFRGAVACVASQISGPLVEAWSNGWMNTGWAFVLALAQAMLMLVCYRGTAWRAAKAKDGRF